MALDAGTVFASLGGRFDGRGFALFGSAMARARTDMERHEKAMTASQQRVGRASAVLGTAAKAGAAAGIAAVGVAAYQSVKLAANFEAQLASLKSVSDATGKQMGTLKKQALDAGAATKFSALDAARAQTELAKGGLTVTQILGGGLKAALGLAAAGELDLSEAAATTANAMNLFGLKGKDATHIADAMATAANKTTADVHDFALALTQGGGAAKAAGLSFDETMAALETLAAAGVKGSDAGTSLKSALTQIASPTKKSAEEMKKLGLDFFDAHGKMKPLPEVAGMLQDELKGLTKEQRLNAVSTIAGTDGMRAILALYDAGPKKVASYEDGLKKQGTAAQVAAEKQDNLKGKLENLQGSIETIGIILGSKLIPGLTDGAEAATKFLNDLQAGRGDAGKAMREISDAAEDVAPVLQEIARIGADMAGGVVKSLGGVARAVSGVIHTISALIHGDLGGAVDGIKEIFGGLGQAVGGAVQQITAPFRAVAGALEAPFRQAIDVILGLFSTMLGTVADVVGKLSGLPIIGGKFKGLADGIRDTAASIDTLREKVRGVPDKTVKIKPEGIGDVVADLARIRGLKVPDKVQKILGQSGDAEAKVRALKQLNLPQKVQRILGSNLDALSKVNAVKAALAGLRDRTVYIRTVRQFSDTTRTESRRGHASGRGTGGAERALIGEGMGPEWRVNPDTGMAYRTAGPEFVDLAPGDYVVPTDPRYRGRALGLLSAIAQDLGVSGYAPGRKAKKKTTKKAPTKKDLPVPDRIALGGVPFEDVEQDYQTRRDAYQAAKKDRTSHVKQRDAAKHRLNRVPPTTKKSNHDRERSNARDALRREERELQQAEAHLRRLEGPFRKAEAYWKRAKQTDDQTKDLESAINLARDRMDDANRRDDQGTYNAARTDRQGQIKSLIVLLQTALGLANPKSDYARTLRERLSKLGGAKAVAGVKPGAADDATFGGDLGDPALSDVETAGETDAQKAAREAAEKLADTGLTPGEQGELTGLDAQEKLAALTAGLDDDRSAAAARVAFFERILGLAQTDPARGGNATIANIAGLLKQARDSAEALSGASGSVDNQDVQAQLDQERERRRVAERERDVANQAVAVFGGPGDIGSGGVNAYAAARPHIVIQTLHPGDPTTLRAVGDAATAGMALQPARTSPREKAL